MGEAPAAEDITLASLPLSVGSDANLSTSPGGGEAQGEAPPTSDSGTLQGLGHADVLWPPMRHFSHTWARPCGHGSEHDPSLAYL